MILEEKNFNWLKVLGLVLAIGLFIQMSGKVWIESGSARNTQVYIWLLLPALVFFIYKAISKCPMGFDFSYLPWALFLLWMALSTLWSSGSENSSLSLMKRGLYIAIYLAAILFLMRLDESFLRRAILAGVTVVALGALVSLVHQFYVLGQSLSYRGFRIDRSGIGNFANYGWPVVAGILHGALATWALGVALDKQTSKRLATFFLVVFLVLSSYVLFTYTRGALFALVASSFFVVICQNSKRGWIFLISSVLLVLVAALLWWDYLVFEATQRQLSGRGPIWEFFFSKIQGHWIFGYGLGTPFDYVWPDNVRHSPHAHSLYLQQIYDGGLISLALMGLGLWGLARKSWNLRTNYWIRLAFPALIFALVAMLTDVERIFTRPGDYWSVFWLPVAVLLAVPGNRIKSQHS